MPQVPTISVVTIVYNRRSDLETTVKNVCAQKTADVEYVVVDGASNDGTVDLIREHQPCIDRWVSERDRGIYDAMNKGVTLAKGEWIIFMNAGDLFYDADVLDFFSKKLGQYPEAAIVYGDAEIVEGDALHVQYQKDRHLDLTKSIIHQSMFIRRDFLLANPYDMKYKIMADYDNLLSISTVSPRKCKHVDKIVCRYDKTGISSRPLYTYFGEYYRIARTRMNALEFAGFNIYILPRLLWSLRHRMK